MEDGSTDASACFHTQSTHNAAHTDATAATERGRGRHVDGDFLGGWTLERVKVRTCERVQMLTPPDARRFG